MAGRKDSKGRNLVKEMTAHICTVILTAEVENARQFMGPMLTIMLEVGLRCGELIGLTKKLFPQNPLKSSLCKICQKILALTYCYHQVDSDQLHQRP